MLMCSCSNALATNSTIRVQRVEVDKDGDHVTCTATTKDESKTLSPGSTTSSCDDVNDWLNFAKVRKVTAKRARQATKACAFLRM